MDIGSLTGEIAIDDQMSHAFDLLSERVRKFADQFDGALGSLVISVGVGVAAVTGLTAAITALGNRGADVNDAASSLEHFAGSAKNAEDIMAGLRTGTMETIDDFELMKTGSQLLSAGVKLNAADFKALGSAAFALQNRGLGKTKDMMNLLTTAMVTGRTRGLAMKVGVIDIGDAEEVFAKKLGTTRDRLTDTAKAMAHQQEVLRISNAITRDAGNVQRDFGEQLEFVRAKILNWVDDLGRAIAVSPNVARAMEAIGEALQKSFGGAGQSAIEIITGLVNKFADLVTRFAPTIIQAMADIAKGIGSVFNFVTGAIDLIPDWFKTVAKNAALTAIAIGLVSTALTALTYIGVTPFLLGIGQVLAGLGTSGLTTIPIIVRIGSVLQNLSFIEAVTLSIRALGTALLGLVATPLGIAVAFTSLGIAIYQTTRTGNDWLTRVFAWTLGIKEFTASQKEASLDALELQRLLASSAKAKDIELPDQKAEDAKKALIEADKAYAKKVEELRATLRGEGQDLAVVRDAIRGLTEAQKANSDVLIRVLPELDKLANARIKLSDGTKNQRDNEKALYDIGLIYKQQLVDTDMAQIKKLGGTYLLIESYKKQGLTLDNIARKYGTTKDAVESFIAVSKEEFDIAKNSQEEIAKVLKKNDEMRAVLADQGIEGRIAKIKVDAQAEVDVYNNAFTRTIEQAKAFQEARNKLTKTEIDTEWQKLTLAGYEIVLKAYNELNDEMKKATLSTTDYEIFKAHEAAVERLRAFKVGVTGTQEQYDLLKKYTDASEQHKVDLANKTAGTIIERMHAVGILTAKELDDVASAARIDFEQMRDSGVYTAEQLGIAWEKAFALAFPEIIRLHKNISELSSILRELASVTDGAFGSVISDLASMVEGLDKAAKAAERFRKAQAGGDTVGEGLALLQGASAVAGATNPSGKSKWATIGGGALAGGLLGAEIGTSVFPGVGTALGFGIGATAGAIIGIYRAFKGVSDEVKAARKAVGEFETSLWSSLTAAQALEAGGQGWAATTIGVRDAYLAAGLSIADADAAVRRLWESANQGPEATAAAQAAIQSIINRNKEIMDSIHQNGWTTQEELQAVADKAKAVYEFMLRSGKYSAEQVAEAWQQSAHAQAVALGDAAAIAADAAEAAGFKTRDQLEQIAAKAKSTYEYMRDSGLYTSAEVQRAWEAMNDAQLTAFDGATDSIDALEAKFKSLSDSIADEAPEAVMGVIEAQTRAEMELLQKRMDEQRKSMELDTAAAAEALKNALEHLQVDPIHVGIIFDVPAIPQPDTQNFAGGGTVQPRGTDTVPAMLTPGEHVLTSAQYNARGGGGGTAVIQINGRTLAEVMVPELPGAVARYGIGR